MIKRIKIRANQVGLLFRDGAFERILDHGSHWIYSGFSHVHCERVSLRHIVFEHVQLQEIIKSGQLGDRATVVDLKDHERALVWLDGRLFQIIDSGIHVFWRALNDVIVEPIDARQFQFDHDRLNLVSRHNSADSLLDIHDIAGEQAGVLFVDGRFRKVLMPGRYAFWKRMSEVRMDIVDLREQSIDVSGQDLMTADKVTLRLNAMTTFRVVDPRKFVCASENATHALYREIQLVLRKVIGARSLDEFLADKEDVSVEASGLLKQRAGQLGLEVVSIGIRDVILPGDMKDLMNKVTEARKAAEANLIFRREETAAMRSQANTAKLLEANPVLMRLRELEVLEKVASSSNLQVVLGESGLGDRLTKLI